MSAALSFHDVRKSFPIGKTRLQALAGVTFRVPDCSFTAIVGTSGCGKSTLLHIAAGLDTQFEGEVVRADRERPTGFLFQTPRLLPWLTAEENVVFILEAQGMRRAEALDVAHRYLALVGLRGFERRYPGQLSGGMQQRVALVRALALEPSLMLMDEPFAALDELTARRLRGELVRLFAEMPRTVLFVTHNATEAVYLADEVVVMTSRPGRVRTRIPVDLPRPRDHDDARIAPIAREVIRNLDPDEPDTESGGSR